MRSNCLILGLFLLALAGCQYEPMDFEENVPVIDDAPIDRDIRVDGSARVTYWTVNQQNQIVDGCWGIYGVAGWVEEDLGPSDTGCVGCSEDYTFAQQLEETNCDTERARGAVSVALMGMEFFPTENDDFASELAWMTREDPGAWWCSEVGLPAYDPTHEMMEGAGEHLGFALTNWSASGPRGDGEDFDRALGVFEQADPIADDEGFWDRQLFLSHHTV